MVDASAVAERDRLNAIIWKQEREDRDAAQAAIVGRCFKYRNSYSCPESDDDRWWLYAKVTHVRDGSVWCFEFQRDSRGHFEVRPSHPSSVRDFSGWTEIDDAELNAAWRAMTTDITLSAACAMLI